MKGRDKHCLRERLTLITGIFLLISNIMIVSLLGYNLVTALAGIVVDMGDYEIEVHLVDGLEERLLVFGIAITVMATAVGTYITWRILGHYLEPLDRLSRHMRNSDRAKLLEKTDIVAGTTEIDDMICSYNSMVDRLSSAFETQRNFSEYIAHELRTPLAVTRARIDVWRKEGSGDPDELLDSISRQVRMLSDMVDGILELTGVERVKLLDDVPLGMLSEEVLLDLEDMARANGVQIGMDESAILDERLVVKGNHDLLHRALYNIVQNGIKYNRPGGKVEIGMGSDEEGVYLSVSDTGIGIPESELRDIFRPFHRCEKSFAEGRPGYGIGLALTEKILEHHGASVKVKSGEDEGSVFLIRFAGKGDDGCGSL